MNFASIRDQLLDYLGNVEDGASPLVARLAIDEKCFGCDYDQLQAAIDDLISDGEVVERADAHTGCRKVGIRNLVEIDEAEYESLKANVHRKAKAAGLTAKWKPNHFGWHLVDGAGEIVAQGPMSHLEDYLDGLLTA